MTNPLPAAAPYAVWTRVIPSEEVPEVSIVNDELLRLVREALDEIDRSSVAATARRTARLASMLGETELAVRLGLELKPGGGHPPTNAAETRRLMVDPSAWGDSDGPAELAITAYMAHRTIPDSGLILSHGLEEIDMWLDIFAEEQLELHDRLAKDIHMRAVRDRVRHSCFTALCEWERRLTYANTNEQVFERFRAHVDHLLSKGSPQVLDQFNAVHRRLRDVAANPEAEGSEELSQAVSSCRRILKAVADHLLPGERKAATEDGHPLDDAAYRNRVFEYIKRSVASGTAAEVVSASFGGLIERFNSIDQLASRGVHADVALPEAELCAIQTYIVAGELLRIAAAIG
jgi:5-methylcytosine-specific restriction endonuclease McrA